MKPIYFDAHATTPVDPRVVEAMLPYFTEQYGNSSSDHVHGHQAKKAVEHAREAIAGLVHAKPREIIFTSGATESDNFVLKGLVERYPKRNHIITTPIEHSAILKTCEWLEERGTEVTYLNVDNYGRINLEQLRDALTDRTLLVSIMAANNEIGTIQPLEQIGEIVATHKRTLFHTDAAQAFGQIPLDVQKMNIHLMSMSAHKCYGPKGVGALYVRGSNPRVRLAPLLHGGGHERGFRSGTLNVPGIVGFGKAAEIAKKEMATEAERLRQLSDRMFNKLRSELEGVHLNSAPERLPHNLHISIDGVDNKILVQELREHSSFSTGSACTAHDEKDTPSHVLVACGYNKDRINSSIRIGLTRDATIENVEAITHAIAATVKRLRQL